MMNEEDSSWFRICVLIGSVNPDVFWWRIVKRLGRILGTVRL